jgi:long-chain acyl-CoA synthetase
VAAEDRFRWHPAARLIGPDGVAVAPTTDAPDAVIRDDPSGGALAFAMARAARGLAFRIGAPDAPAPRADAVPVFESLTSGSSGQPRRIRRSQQSWIASFAINAGLFGIGSGTRVAVLGRPVHSLTLYGAVEGLHLGAEVHLLDGLRPDKQRAALAERAVDVVYATPAQLRLMAEAGGPALPLRLILTGGAKLDPTLRADLAVMAPAAAIREFYGAAEASFISLSDPTHPAASVGVAYPDVAIDIRSPDGMILPDGMMGAVWVRSPYLFDGYGDGLDGPARWQDGWLTVGEIGRLDQGALYLAGRAGRMVTVADQNVFPEEIEALLSAQAGIRRVVVLPRPDRLRGSVLVAVAMGDPSCEGRVLKSVRQVLGPLKAPRAMIWRQDWPELPTGKPDLTRIAREAGL